MPSHVRISVTFLDPDPRFHGRGDGGVPEWPPSPLRLYQAIVAANADQLSDVDALAQTLRWLERQPPPHIVAPYADAATPYYLSVPNNALDLVARAWARGKMFGTGDANPATHRTMKTVQPHRMTTGDTIHYLWPIANDDTPPTHATDILRQAASRVVALGWGIDLVAADADQCAEVTPTIESRLQHWIPSEYQTNTLRTPRPGTLDALASRHADFLQRVGPNGFSPVPPLTRFNITGYRRDKDPLPRPHRLFELRKLDGDRYRHPISRLIHLAAMLRHLAIERLGRRGFAPPDAPTNWLETFVAGHADTHHAETNDSQSPHRQLSYIPLPSIGHQYTDPGIRRVMIAAPQGHDTWLDAVANQLAGQQLIPENGYECGQDDDGNHPPPPILVPIPRQGDSVTRCYTRPSTVWHSFTPVILPGHDDHKPAKRKKLIIKALEQTGIEQPCEFEWSPISRFPKAPTAHKYDRDESVQDNAKRWRFPGLPKYLQDRTWTHLTLTFHHPVPGPILIGAGRHRGFGLMAKAT